MRGTRRVNPAKIMSFGIIFIALFAILSTVSDGLAQSSTDLAPRYRLYNPNNGHHHYTTNSNEYSVLGSLGWAQEGMSCYLYNGPYQIGAIQTAPYYRLYNPNSGEHHWTTNANEYQFLGTIGWRQEGVDGHVFASQVTGSQPLYRLYNPNAGLHHWTMDANERSVIIGYGWKDEGIACYVFATALQTGDFWEYSWDYKRIYSSAHNSSTGTDSGTFRLTLGEPREINGVTTFEVITTGKSGNTSCEFKPRWTYLAMTQNKILGSQDGTTLVTLYDGQKGSWPGSGFFGTFASNQLCTASSGTIDNDYITSPAKVISTSSSKSQCEYFSGFGTICGGDYNQNNDIREYYGENIGPLGYYSYFAISDWNSIDPYSTSTTKNVGLVKSSLRGDTVDYDFEAEPNNSPDTAQGMTFSWGIEGTVAYEDRNQSTTVTLNQVQEVEPHDSRNDPQTLGFPAHVSGSASDTDPSFLFEYTHRDYGLQKPTGEDWYKFTLTAASNVTINLDFAGSSTDDLDLFLFSGSSSSPSYYSTSQAGTLNEKIAPSLALAAGTYTIAVDAWDTPSGTVSYTLDISTTGKGNQVTVEDWYSFTLDSQATVTISLAFDDSRSDMDLYLFDQNGQSLIASSRNGTGLQENISVNLGAGTYKVGVDLTNQWNTNYSLTIQ